MSVQQPGELVGHGELAGEFRGVGQVVDAPQPGAHEQAAHEDRGQGDDHPFRGVSRLPVGDDEQQATQPDRRHGDEGWPVQDRRPEGGEDDRDVDEADGPLVDLHLVEQRQEQEGDGDGEQPRQQPIWQDHLAHHDAHGEQDGRGDDVDHVHRERTLGLRQVCQEREDEQETAGPDQDPRVLASGDAEPNLVAVHTGLSVEGLGRFLVRRAVAVRSGTRVAALRPPTESLRILIAPAWRDVVDGLWSGRGDVVVHHDALLGRLDRLIGVIVDVGVGLGGPGTACACDLAVR